jgi:hypothetical protein
MHVKRIRRPSAALVVATVALFVALSGTAGAVVNAAVPLAKRALVADNAKKLQGKTAAALVQQAAAQPGPASTATGLVSIISAPAGQVASGTVRTVDVVCGTAGTKVIAGGMSSDGAVATFDSFPKSDNTWEIAFGNLGDSPANVNVYALCLR